LFETLHPLGFNSAQIKDIANSLHGQPGKQFVSKEWRVIKDRNLLLLETIRPEDESTLPYQLIKEEREFTPDFRIPREKETACFDADKLNEEIHCRKWQAGRLNSSESLLYSEKATSGCTRAIRSNSARILLSSVELAFRNLRRAGILKKRFLIEKLLPLGQDTAS
jgi:hypothetical protein